MDQNKTQLVLRNALTGFIPGAFLFMAIFAVGLPVALSPRGLETLQHMSLKVLLLELILLAGGYASMTLAIGAKHLTQARWRSVSAGVGGVILLAVLSVFLQGAGLATIVLASISAGMLSVLFGLRRTRQVQDLPHEGQAGMPVLHRN